ncbi:MAG: hypothetical protein K6G91_09245 [Kiritimatiellae bacterium]|nr:hypothetical protein [Kiritimatiellia bacterium]
MEMEKLPELNKVNKLFAGSMDALGKLLKRSSAMGPILGLAIMMAVVTVVSIITAPFVPNLVWLCYISIGTLTVIVIAAVSVFIFFSLTNPRVLQSEQLQITMRQMDLAVASKGEPPAILMDIKNEEMQGRISTDAPAIVEDKHVHPVQIENAVKEAHE